MLINTRAGLGMPLLDFVKGRVFLLVARWVLVGKFEVIAVPDVVFFTGSSGLTNSPYNLPALSLVPVCEQRSVTQILGVLENHFHVLCRPGKAWSFAEPANAPPEINPLFNASFFAFVARNLR